MATSSVTSPVTRETCARVHDKGSRAIIVRIEGAVLMLRAKRMRRWEELEIGTLYLQAVRARVAREKAEKRKAKKGR